MNIKEKFNNLFKYPTTYVFALSGYETLFFYYKIFFLTHSLEYNGTGTGMAVVYYLLIQSCIFFIFLGVTILTYIIFKIFNYEIKKHFFNNVYIKIITSIGLISSIIFIGYLIFLAFYFFYLKIMYN